MISTQSLELRAGARLLIGKVTVRINNGDRIGFVGRNGAGKSTLADTFRRILERVMKRALS
jgi:ATPase subunit of ABC transporter with duplicated ATPase domains